MGSQMINGEIGGGPVQERAGIGDRTNFDDIHQTQIRFLRQIRNDLSRMRSGVRHVNGSDARYPARPRSVPAFVALG